MRNYSLPLLVVFTIILCTLHLCSCRHISWATHQQTDQTMSTKFSFPFPHHLSAISRFLQSGDDKASTVYGVSHKLVPGGPNPLHN
ncbi:hypothetical protein MANES_14G026900v8 [Manihot esculenta]|uniref:Uncharacterized protein n=1 Tax=Manihot esculenta TaxID=3983 RepID=A0A2C9UK16_MANES|nr:hypothetical protein MANES_14G026900v8 [Manihot esculenta]